MPLDDTNYNGGEPSEWTIRANLPDGAYGRHIRMSGIVNPWTRDKYDFDIPLDDMIIPSGSKIELTLKMPVEPGEKYFWLYWPGGFVSTLLTGKLSLA